MPSVKDYFLKFSLNYLFNLYDASNEHEPLEFAQKMLIAVPKVEIFA